MNALLQSSVLAHSAPARRVCLQCTVCGQALRVVDSSDASPAECVRCGFVAACVDGIWRTLPPERSRYYERFMREYAEVRAREGRGSPDPSYYLALPFADLTGRNAWQWSIRATTFHYFARRILPRIESARKAPLRILDVGAGNGWLSYRLALRGHQPVAVDLLDNSEDGLAAAIHYFPACGPFLRLQAEMDRLPFVAAQFDAVIFNAAFHYATNFVVTMREALRCLQPGGFAVVLDSPYYNAAESGRKMVAERREHFLRTYGFASDSVPSREFLTGEDVRSLRHTLGVEWQLATPWYGWRWAMRPWKARLLRRREPAKFHVMWGRADQ